MKHIYRYKENGQLYTLEHLILDIRFLNGNANAGVYAYPFVWPGKQPSPLYPESICFKSNDPEVCDKWIKDNFTIVAELFHY